MKNFVIDIICQTASFRDPNFQNFHKSLELPPPTTIIGFSGAALGFSPLKSQDFFENADFKIGISGIYKGKCSDTWKYLKGIRAMRFYDPGLDGSIIQREYLINASFSIVFSSENEKALKKLKEAFENPVYALTMGNSDSLAHIQNIEIDKALVESNIIRNCFMEGNVINEVITEAEKGKLEFSVYSNETILYDLPLRFDYENDYGKRSISRIGTFTLIGKEMKLNYNVEGIQHNQQFIPLFSI